MIRANYYQDGFLNARTAAVVGVIATVFASLAGGQAIDREAVVARHNLQYERYTPKAPAQVGNGEFAFTFDITGLQTFPGAEPGELPLGTMAQWSWHSFPGSENYDYDDTLRDFDVHGRTVSYATDMRSETATAIRANPHRFNLARIALRLTHDDGQRATAEDVTRAMQIVTLWSGEAESHFTFAGQPVMVRTVAHPSLDAVAFSIESPLIASGHLAIEVSFAYPAGIWGPEVDNWNAADRHETELQTEGEVTRLVRTLDGTQYGVDITTSGNVVSDAPHVFAIERRHADRLDAVIHFVADPNVSPKALSFDQTQSAAADHWRRFWSTGAAIDLSGSSDPRWSELERRIVLSQYLTAIQCAGSMPPQETGLLCNSWYGKSHLEMHWWHAAHFALWGRFDLLEKSLDWYSQILPAAQRIAERQGYAGVRWPKMTGPNGVSSPSEVGELLIWQQPHPIYFAELAYRNDPSGATLERYYEIVKQTADFMADYAYFDEPNDRYVLGPVLIPAQECYDGRSAAGVLNPTFELAYWRWALNTADLWRERLGLETNEKWAEVASKMAKPNIRQGVYAAIENSPYTRRRDHPSMLAALGVMPDVGLIDRDTMRRTLVDVDNDWQWADTWGWDYPMMAMTAARLGMGSEAIDYLLRDTPKNDYLQNGHCRQEDRLPIYLPANGGLLTAVAMMAAGWDGSEELGEAPGFPDDGSWEVRHEGLKPMP